MPVATHPITAQFEALKKTLTDIAPDVAKFDEKNNAAAGVRIRHAMQEVKTAAQGIRETIVLK